MVAPPPSAAHAAASSSPPPANAVGAASAAPGRGAGTLAERIGLPSNLLIPACISAILSGVMTWLNVGLVDGFLWRWLTSFVCSMPMMLVGMVLMRTYERLLLGWLPHVAESLRRLLRALMMALTLESLMSSVVTLRNVGWVDGFASAWVNAFTHSLPVGLCIGLLMSFVIGPRLQRQRRAASRPLQPQDN